MGFNREAVSRVKIEYANKYRDAIRKSEILRAELHRNIPALAEIDSKLARTGLEVMDAITTQGSDIEAHIEKLKEKNVALQKEREALLVSLGFPT